MVAEKRIERVPVIEAIKRQPKLIILTALARMGEQAPSYIYLAFVLAYGTQILHIQRDFLLTSLSAAGITSFVTIPLAGHLSDRIGRRGMRHHRRGCDRDSRLHLRRDVELDGTRLDLLRHRAVVHRAVT